jgi:hypothetical protein
MSKNNNNGEWKFKMTEWRGYVVRSLEEHDKKLDTVHIDITELKDHVNHRMAQFEKEMGAMKTKQATAKTEWSIYRGALVGLASLAGGLILHLVLSAIGL